MTKDQEVLLILSVLLGVACLAGYLLYRQSPRYLLMKHLKLRRSSDLALLMLTVPRFFHEDVLLKANELIEQAETPQSIMVNPNQNLGGFFAGKSGFDAHMTIAFGVNVSPIMAHLEVGPDEYKTVPVNRLAATVWNGQPVVLDPTDSAGYGSSVATYQIAYHRKTGQQAAEAFVEHLREQIMRYNRYRGKLLTLTGSDDLLDVTAVKIMGRPPEDPPILGEKAEAEIRGAILDFMEHREALKACGLGTKRGVLLVGPPGTGKTTIARWLLHKVPDYTAILVRGESPNHIRLIFRLARALCPSLILLEDVDLLATNRYQNSFSLFLGALMTEMDGVEKNEDVMVLMTTNDASEMEQALIRRPGRIDRIIEVGNPVAAVRARLLEHFLPNLEGEADLDKVAEACDGLMPAAIKEVVHQAALKALREKNLTAEGHPKICTEDLLEVLPPIQDQFKEPDNRVGFRRK